MPLFKNFRGRVLLPNNLVSIISSITSSIPVPSTRPSIENIPNFEILPNVYFTYTPTVNNPDGYELEYVLTGTLPTGLVFNTETGQISGTPTLEEIASGLVVTIFFSEGLDSDFSNAFTIEVNTPDFWDGSTEYIESFETSEGWD